jgi:hypothetical protein
MRAWRAAVAANKRTRNLLFRWLRRTTHGAMKRAWMRWVEATTVCVGLAPSLIAPQQLHTLLLVPLRALRTAAAPSLQVCPTPLFSCRVYTTARARGVLFPCALLFATTRSGASCRCTASAWRTWSESSWGRSQLWSSSTCPVCCILSKLTLEALVMAGCEAGVGLVGDAGRLGSASLFGPAMHAIACDQCRVVPRLVCCAFVCLCCGSAGRRRSGRRLSAPSPAR